MESRDSQQAVWPMAWLPEEFPSARVLSVTYDASIINMPEQGRFDLHNVAESLMQDLSHAEVGGRSPLRSVILVGHSYGGLVIKQLCLHANLNRAKERMAEFLSCIKGLFFYGTPHRGMPTFFNSEGKSTFLDDASPLMEYVKLLSAESARLHENFEALRHSYGWQIAGVGETRAATWGSLRELIVPEASMRYGEFTMEDEDHISLCRPASRTSNTYIRLTHFIRRACDEVTGGRERKHPDLQTLPKIARTLGAHLVGEVLHSFRTDPVVGLCGTGGVGKTTLAKLLLNELCADFEYTCFVPDTKLIKGDANDLDKRVKMCMHRRGRETTQHDWDWDDLSKEAICIVLDDIENDLHLQILERIQSKNKCDSSRYFVTSRDNGLLNSLYAPVFSVQKLGEESSKMLFMSYAFPEKTVIPSPSLGDHVDKIVAKCDGLPLTLEVMCKYLFRKANLKIWKQCLQALDEADSVIGLDDRSWTKLKVSYGNLSSAEKEMFLDAATFFCNNSRWKLRDAKSCWRVLYGNEDLRWHTLKDMSLVYDVKK